MTHAHVSKCFCHTMHPEEVDRMTIFNTTGQKYAGLGTRGYAVIYDRLRQM